MRQRHVDRFLCLIAASALAIIIAAYLVLDHIRRERIRPPFVEPVIWRVPYTGGAPQLQPEI